MNKITKLLVSSLILMVLLVPVVVLGQEGPKLIPCDGVGVDCDFTALMTLVNNVIRFILFNLALPIAAVMFVYAGGLMVISGGSSESRTKAKKIFTNAVIGLVLAAGAWLIIRTILVILGYDGAWIGF